jgi:RNA polymerase sigma factor (sigma-70 family)
MRLPKTNTKDYANNVDIAAKVFARYGDFIHAIIRCKVRNEAQADDLYQDFFLSLVFRPIPASVQNVKSYLYKAITNDIIDAFRQAQRHRILISRYAEQHFNYRASEKGPENAFIEAEEVRKFFEIVEKQLPNSQARAVTLRYKNSYDIKEIAEKMKVNKNSVIRYVSVGLKRIRQFLAVERGN